MTPEQSLNMIRAICNVDREYGARYTVRFQQAIDAVVALCEPHAEPKRPAYSDSGSDYGRGFADGLHAKAHQVLAELVRALVDPDDDPDPELGDPA